MVVAKHGLWERYIMAMDKLTDRLNRITGALKKIGVPYALGGGQAVAYWVATKEPAAVRTTPNVDLLLEHGDVPQAEVAAATVGLDYFEVVGRGMFLEGINHPRH